MAQICSQLLGIMTKKQNKSKKINPPAAESPGKRTPNQILSATAQTFSGPLPPPEILAKYNSVVPNAAERIITMAETQAAHRQRIESKVIESNIRNSRLGLHYGLIIGLASVLGGVVCILYGHEIGGTILGGTGLSSLVGVFVYGSIQKKKERENRLKLTIGQP